MSELLIKGFKQLGSPDPLTLDYSGITATIESAPVINDKPLIEDTETGKVIIQLTAADVNADPEGSAENALNAAKQYTDDEIAKIPAPDVSAQIGAHNTDPNAHESIRNSIIEVSNKVDTEVNNAIGAIQESIGSISEDLDAHIADKNNPHIVTAPQIGTAPI